MIIHVKLYHFVDDSLLTCKSEENNKTLYISWCFLLTPARVGPPEPCKVQPSYFWQCPEGVLYVLMTKSDGPLWDAPITRGQIIERTRRTLTGYAHERFITSKGYTAPGARKHKATLQRLEHLGTASRVLSLFCRICCVSGSWSTNMSVRYLFQGRQGTSLLGDLSYLTDHTAKIRLSDQVNQVENINLYSVTKQCRQAGTGHLQGNFGF